MLFFALYTRVEAVSMQGVRTTNRGSSVGLDGAALTTIEAQTDTAVRIAPGVAVSIEGLTLSGAGLYPALAVGGSAQVSLLDGSLTDGIGSSGGCVSVDTAASLVATTSVFSGCTSLDAGGALVGYDAVLSLTDCTIDSSDALWGGAVAAYGGEVSLESTQISGNHANDGGALWANSAQVSISNAVFEGNTAGSPQVGFIGRGLCGRFFRVVLACEGEARGVEVSDVRGDVALAQQRPRKCREELGDPELEGDIHGLTEAIIVEIFGQQPFANEEVDGLVLEELGEEVEWARHEAQCVET